MVARNRRTEMKTNSLPACKISLRRVFRLAALTVYAITIVSGSFVLMAGAKGDWPVSGVEVPELAVFDTMMQTYMSDHGISAGVLAISRDERIVYQRGFGYAYNGISPLPENTPMRVASVEKPHTAAVIRRLVSAGVISVDDLVFNVGQRPPPGRRLLLDASTPSSPYYPYDGEFEDWDYLAAITVNHLLNHRGGWDREIAYDPFGRLFTIGTELGTYPGEPPTRRDIVRYMMSQPMQFDPRNPVPCNTSGGDCTGEPAPCYCDPYSNYGYMLLSLIIEQETRQQHTHAIRQMVLTPEIWVPSTEVFLGRDYRAEQSPREPKYWADGQCINLPEPYILYPTLKKYVPCPYGGLLMEVKTGEGNLVASAAPLLTFLHRYRASGWDVVGNPIIAPVNGAKNGGLNGTSTRIQQWDDGFCAVVLFARGGGHADEVMPQVRTFLSLLVGVDWDSLKPVDGFWVDFNAAFSGYGGYDDPFHTMDKALTATTDGTKLRFKPGASDWTGTISERMMLTAPFGPAIIGQ